MKPPRRFLLASPRPSRLRAALSVNLKLFRAWFIINVLRCFSRTLNARRWEAEASSTFSRGGEAGTRLCAVAPTLVFSSPNYAALLFCSWRRSLGSAALAASLVMWLSECVHMHAVLWFRSSSCLVESQPPTRGLWLVGVISHLIAALPFGLNSKKGQCSFLHLLLCGYVGKMNQAKSLKVKTNSPPACNTHRSVWFGWDTVQLNVSWYYSGIWFWIFQSKGFLSWISKRWMAEISLAWCPVIAWNLRRLMQKEDVLWPVWQTFIKLGNVAYPSCRAPTRSALKWSASALQTLISFAL